jgi:pumilio family protein 6
VWKSFPSDEIATAVLEACVGESGKDSKTLSIFEDPVGHLVLKNMILDESVDSETKESGPSFVSAFHGKFKGNLIQIASSNRGAFVLTALSKNSAVHGDVVKELNKNKAELKKLVQGGQDEKGKKITAGYDALLLELGAAKKNKK